MHGGTKRELVEDASYSSSADINAIERMWAELKRFIAIRVKSLSKSELIGGIVLFWSMTQDKVRQVHLSCEQSFASGSEKRRYRRRID